MVALNNFSAQTRYLQGIVHFALTEVRSDYLVKFEVLRILIRNIDATVI